MIKLENATRIYKGDTYEIAAINQINLSIDDGEFVAITGRSGSGKSTLLNIIGCMDNLTSGDYFLDGRKITNLNPFQFDTVRKNNIAFIFQKYELMSQYTVYENIELPLNVIKCNSTVKKKKIADIMERLQITGLEGKFPKQISGGEQQRVAIARAYVSDKKYLLADEPTGALDEKNACEIMEIFKELSTEGKTIILVTHDSEVAACAKRIIRISNGQICE